jgi:outer membrane immunogenic protein
MRFAAAAVGAVVICSPAFAADLPAAQYPPVAPAYVPAPGPYNWTGFYVGVNGGYAFGSSNTTSTFSGGPLGGTTTTAAGNSSGVTGGGQIGANYQINAFVVGIEGDFDWSGQQDNTTQGCGPSCAFLSNSKIEWVSTIRGRFGAAFDRILVYGTGGAAWTSLSQNVTQTLGGVSTTIFDSSSVDVGWTLGGGVEAALAQNWTVRAEYLYVQTNASLSGSIGVVGGTVNESGTVKDSIVRAALNYKFP